MLREGNGLSNCLVQPEVSSKNWVYRSHSQGGKEMITTVFAKGASSIQNDTPGSGAVSGRATSGTPIKINAANERERDLRVFKAADAERERKIEDWCNQRHGTKTQTKPGLGANGPTLSNGEM